MLIPPLIVLAAVASYFSGIGLAASWFISSPFQYAIGAAMQASFILRSEKTSPLLTVLAWCVCLWWCDAGLGLAAVPYPFTSALVLETTCLLLSRRGPWVPVSERIAAWRREQARIAVQLQMSEGALPWARRTICQCMFGKPASSAGQEYLRWTAVLKDAENRFQAQVSKTVMPEHLRQTVLTSVTRISARAEAAAAARAAEMDQLVLEAAALCRDECSQMEDLGLEERRALADRCEQALLEFAHH